MPIRECCTSRSVDLIVDVRLVISGSGQGCSVYKNMQMYVVSDGYNIVELVSVSTALTKTNT